MAHELKKADECKSIGKDKIPAIAVVDETCTIPAVIPKQCPTPTLPGNEDEFQAMIQKGLMELELKRRNSVRSAEAVTFEEARARLQTM